MVTAYEKNKQKQKLNDYLHQVFLSFYCSKISLFLFSLLPMIYLKHGLKQWDPIEDLSTIENYFSPSVLTTFRDE